MLDPEIHHPLIWNLNFCNVKGVYKEDVLRQSSQFCKLSRGIEVTCKYSHSLLSAVNQFLNKLSGVHIGECWPIVISCGLVLSMFEHSGPEIDEFLSSSSYSGSSSLAKALSHAEYYAFENTYGLEFGQNSFDLRKGGLVFFSTARSARSLLVFHRGFSSAHLGGCAPQMRGTFSLRARPASEIPCAAEATNEQLIRRCKYRRLITKAAKVNRTWPKHTRCPEISAASLAGDEKYWMIEKWNLMFNESWCEPPPAGAPHGAGWLTGTPEQIAWQKCSFKVIMDWILPPPGSWFLDWGSACGHKLVWAKQFYGLRVVGVEYQRESVEWARRHAPSLDLVCHADGRDLSWLPEDFFDGAHAFGAMNYLSAFEQCDTVLQMIRKLRVGARAVIGYNSPGHDILKFHDSMEDNSLLKTQRPGHMLPPYEVWRTCFQERGPMHKVNVLHDIVIDNSWYFSRIPESDWRQPRETSYALLLTRLS